MLQRLMAGAGNPAVSFTAETDRVSFTTSPRRRAHPRLNATILDQNGIDHERLTLSV